MKLVRIYAKKWHVDSNKIGIIGYSDDGYLASTIFMILVYPVISMKDVLNHQFSKENLSGPHPIKEKVNFFSSEENILPKHFQPISRMLEMMI